MSGDGGPGERVRESASRDRDPTNRDRDPASRHGGSAKPPTLRGLLASVLAAVRSRPAADLALVTLPLPALLVGVSLLPGVEAWRFSLATEGVLENRWSLWTAFASSFVHADPVHLADNVVNYWLLVAVAYPLSVVAGWRRRLLGSVAVYLAVVPLVSAWATVVALGGMTDAPTAGFSDVNSALLGYLVVVWFAALAAEWERDGDRERNGDRDRGGDQDRGGNRNQTRRGSPADIDPRWSVVAVFASLALAHLAPSGVGYFPPLPAVGSLFAVGAVVAAAGLSLATGRPRVTGLGLSPERELLYVTGASVAAAGVIGSLVLVPFGSNVFAHLAGYAVGFAVPFVGVLADAETDGGGG
ncbi:rhomboid family intramembrane serine protease [Halorubrum sp. LN27]|uniref:rhomboid family intramembrane serine protease n=1 Tax=Halorubrum sp. LN27 TaxID=2801032 RepID=UPI00190D1958|nr:rhomboid family intramembrane serine protease [Halorubrum sp. LN27]